MAEMFGFLQVVAFLIAEGAMMCRWQISECSNQARTDSTLRYEVDDDQGRIMMIKVLLICPRHIWTIIVEVLI